MSTPRRQLRERGWAVIEGVFGPDDNRDMKALIEGIWSRSGRPPLGGRFGFAVQPLASREPEVAPWYGAARLAEIMAEVLEDRPRLEYTGALLADETRQFCPWHNHLGGVDRELLGRTEAELWGRFRAHHPGSLHRIVANVYVDGLDDRVGELLVSPRPADAPLQPPAGPALGDWIGQERVRCAPGSLVLLDEAVFHAARPPAGLGDQRRLLWGGFFVGWSTPVAERLERFGPALDGVLAAVPGLRALVREPG